MVDIKESNKLEEILDAITEHDNVIGHDFGWSDVHGHVDGCYALTMDAGNGNGNREAEVFQEGIDLAWRASKSNENIYYYEVGDTAFYFLGPIDKLLVSLQSILDECKKEVAKLQTKKAKSKKIKCKHCGK